MACSRRPTLDADVRQTFALQACDFFVSDAATPATPLARFSLLAVDVAGLLPGFAPALEVPEEWERCRERRRKLRKVWARTGVTDFKCKPTRPRFCAA